MKGGEENDTTSGATEEGVRSERKHLNKEAQRRWKLICSSLKKINAERRRITRRIEENAPRTDVPGPGHYDLKGVQPHKKSAPAFTFGDRVGLKISQDDVPAVGTYEQHTAFGPQVFSKNENAVSFPFPKTKRWNDSVSAEMSGTDQPNHTPLGREEHSSRKKNAPKWTFSKSNRGDKIDANAVVSVDSYFPAPSTIGRSTVISKHRAGPRFVFSKEQRFSNDAKGTTNRQKISAIDSPSSLGRQVSSTKSSVPSPTFSNLPRWKRLEQTHRGPGMYDDNIKTSCFGKQCISSSRSAPTWTFGRNDIGVDRTPGVKCRNSSAPANDANKGERSSGENLRGKHAANADRANALREKMKRLFREKTTRERRVLLDQSFESRRPREPILKTVEPVGRSDAFEYWARHERFKDYLEWTTRQLVETRNKREQRKQKRMKKKKGRKQLQKDSDGGNRQERVGAAKLEKGRRRALAKTIDEQDDAYMNRQRGMLLGRSWRRKEELEFFYRNDPVGTERALREGVGYFFYY